MNLKRFEPFKDHIRAKLYKKTKCHEDANDIWQEVMIYLWNRPEENIEWPKKYIWNLANWHCIKFLNNKNKNFRDQISDNLHIDGIKCVPIFNSEIGWNSWELDDKISLRLKTIPKILFESLSMQIFDSLSIKEIAKILDTNENTIKTRIKRAKEYLRT